MPRIRPLGEVEEDVDGQMPRQVAAPAEDTETEGQEFSDAIVVLKEAGGPFIVEIDTDEDVSGRCTGFRHLVRAVREGGPSDPSGDPDRPARALSGDPVDGLCGRRAAPP